MYIFEAFTGLAVIIGFALVVAAFVSEGPVDRDRIEWTIGRRAR